MFKKGAASILAVLILGAFLISPVHAIEDQVSLPQSGAEPVTLHIDASEATVDATWLEVFVGDGSSCCEGRIPVAGRHTIVDATLTFTPAFGFAEGQDYVARVAWPGRDEVLFSFQIPTQTAPIPAVVTETFPSGETLPENTLRFYIHFSVPMAPHVAFDYIRLLDDAGVADDAAFMRFRQELWNENRTRLTVLIDPGRIKREVATNLELGPALEEGREYTLAVEPGWTSADGMSVLPRFSSTFSVSEALRIRPDTSLWHSTTPCLGTLDPLVVSFDRPFDRHLLERDIRVVGDNGSPLGGTILAGDEERSWSFTPHQPWPTEDLRLVANPELEDVAGNNFRDLLDHVSGSQENDMPSTELPISIGNCAG